MDIDQINSGLAKTKYEYLSEYQIHKIEVFDGSLKASDEFFMIYGEILRSTNIQTQNRLMAVVKEKMPSVIYMQRKARELERIHPNRKVRTAVLFSGMPFIVELMETFIAMLRVEANTKFFKLGQENDAQEWLTLQDRETTKKWGQI